ncbi:MAG: low specificity L-threonine aldolase [Planctomycetia bacterium]|nr:low specificity L-threonine aldolase [Planctomycetia bacterium]
MSDHTAPHRQFASDTWAGLRPEALQAMQEANAGHASAYGDDPWTARAVRQLRALFETECEVFFVATGTAANALALAGICQSYHSVICHADAHIQTDECGAPEYAGKGLKLMTVRGPEGKLTPAAIRETAAKRRDVHSHKPHVVSISQATEVGTLYSLEELQAVGATARELGLHLHMDGARFANALATLNAPAKALSWQARVDVLCFGGAKNGVALADVIIFFDRALAADFEYRRKQAGHLVSKLRLFTAPWAALLESGAWLDNAQHANRMARTLESELRAIPDIRILYPVQANAVFVKLPAAWNHALHERGWHFYTIADGERLMCSWDTQPEDVAAFVRDVRACADGT